MEGKSNYEETSNSVAESKDVCKRKVQGANRRKKKVKKQKKLNIIIKIFFYVAIIIFIVFLFRYPHRRILNGIISRDLNNCEFFIQNEPSEERNVAWDSELPKFVEKDIKLSKEKGYTIEYQYGSTTINIFFEEEVPYISFDSPYSSYLYTTFSEYELNNFSIYYSKEKKALLVYGYIDKYGEFCLFTLYSDITIVPEEDTLTYDTNIPLDMDNFISIYSISCGEYSLYFDKSSSTFFFYKDGDIVSSKTFNDPIDTVYRYSGIISTTNNLLYKVYVYEKDGIPDLKFVFISEDAKVLDEYSWGSNYLKLISSNENSMPIVLKNDEFYTFYPEDLEA